jgi:hypothetical protein
MQFVECKFVSYVHYIIFLDYIYIYIYVDVLFFVNLFFKLFFSISLGFLCIMS